MQPIDWIIVVVWIVGTSLVGILFGRRVKSLEDYLLAGRKLRWWQVSVAQGADSVDSSDFVSTSAIGYRIGMTGVGLVFAYMTFGFMALARWVIPSLFKHKIFTNAEFLEERYTRSLRVFSMILQVMYRTVAIAVVVYATAQMFEVVLGVENPMAAILISMAAMVVYTFLGGQLSAVMAAVPQMVLMLFSGVTIFILVWGEVGGLSGLSERLAATPQLMRIGGYSQPGVPVWIYLIGMTLTVATYPLINQAVAQRVLAARSINDAKLGTLGYLPIYWVFGSAIVLVGIAGAALHPGIAAEQADKIYPMMMEHYLPAGLLGAGVAAMLVATMSTGAGIGTAVSSLLTIDLYRRFIRPDAAEGHYLLFARFASLVAIGLGTVLAFFVERMGGIVPFYIAVTGTLFMPMATPYLAVGLFPRASRRSGLTSVVLGAGVGLVLMLLYTDRARSFGINIPVWLGDPVWRAIWVFIVSWIGLIGQTLHDHRRGIVERFEVPRDPTESTLPWWRRPVPYEIAIVVVVVFVLWYGW